MAKRAIMVLGCSNVADLIDESGWAKNLG